MRVTLLELTDTVLFLAGRGVNDLVRRAAGKVQTRRAGSAADYRARLVAIKEALRNVAMTPEQRLAAIEQILPDDADPTPLSAAALTRRLLTDEHAGVRALPDGLCELDFEGQPNDLAFGQWQALRALRARRATSLPVGDQQPPTSSAWSALVGDPDRQRAFRAFEASTMMSMRKALRGGSVWLAHSASFRDRDRMLIPLEEWKLHRHHHIAALGHTASPDAFMEPLLENIRVGLASVADALSDGKLSIDADGTLHLPALEALDCEVVPKRAGKAILDAIGEQQLPDILLEADAGTGFSEAARTTSRPSGACSRPAAAWARTPACGWRRTASARLPSSTSMAL